jgi:uncharacterized phage-associated protein
MRYSEAMETWFNERKAAQVAAFFCEKEGGAISVLKLTKLIYLSDRESMRRCGFPITEDHFVSMPHGPVNSMTLNLINGNCESEEWSDLIHDRADYMVGLARTLTDADIEELNELDLEVLESVWASFGGMNRYQIRDWTHTNCPEWEDPLGSCSPIPYERVLKYLLVQNAEDLAADVAASRHVDTVFKSLRA